MISTRNHDTMDHHMCSINCASTCLGNERWTYSILYYIPIAIDILPAIKQTYETWPWILTFVVFQRSKRVLSSNQFCNPTSPAHLPATSKELDKSNEISTTAMKGKNWWNSERYFLFLTEPHFSYILNGSINYSSGKDGKLKAPSCFGNASWSGPYVRIHDCFGLRSL